MILVTHTGWPLTPSWMQALGSSKALANSWENPKLCSLELGETEEFRKQEISWCCPKHQYKERGPSRANCTSTNDRQSKICECLWVTCLMCHQVQELELSWKVAAQDLPAEVREPQGKKANWDTLPKDRSQRSVRQSWRKSPSAHQGMVLSRWWKHLQKYAQWGPAWASVIRKALITSLQQLQTSQFFYFPLILLLLLALTLGARAMLWLGIWESKWAK